MGASIKNNNIIIFSSGLSYNSRLCSPFSFGVSFFEGGGEKTDDDGKRNPRTRRDFPKIYIHISSVLLSCFLLLSKKLLMLHH